MMRTSEKLQRFAAVAQERFRLAEKDPGNEAALAEAVQWIFRAQDSTPDRGVSHSYLIGRGWMPSYPETTGYIIPTLLNWAQRSGDPEARSRAIEMAEWEAAVQLPNGAVMASVVGRPQPQPAVFNTGQVIFGWLAAHRSSGRPEFLDAAARAGRWLVESLGGDPTWTMHGSMGLPAMHAFNVRTAWAVLLLAEAVNEPAMTAAMRRVLDWTLAQEESPGWFGHNGLDDNDRPLLHTIAYTAQGFLECGRLLGDQRCLEAAQRTALALAQRVGPDGWMSGRFDRDFEGAVPWSCLTGMAQMSIVWRRMSSSGMEKHVAHTADVVDGYLRRSLDLRSRNPGIRGGLKGSRPLHGGYGTFRVLNWATKFCIDALMLEEQPNSADTPEYHPG